MKDLDFDELDRAVNSLMTDVPKTDTSKQENDEKTLNITPTLGENTVPSFDKLEEATTKAAGATSAPVSSPAPSPASSIPPATRRGGRFMDVVHPSADMKKPTVPSRPVSRQGVTIEPSPTAAAAPEPTPVAPAEPKEPMDTPAVQQHQVAEQAAPVSEWPDPLEMADFKDNSATPEKTAQPAAPSVDTQSASVATETSEKTEAGKEGEQAPLTSPFLPDAKVEKRPLGNGNLSPIEEPDHAPVIGDAESDKTVDDPNAQLPALPSDVKPVLPEELQGDLMAVEADTHMGVPKTEETHPSHEEKEKPAISEPKPKKPSPLETPTGPTSIPQQYHEEPSTGDKESGAIYDTDSYHQPLAHPAKKKSGWLWVVWILVILLVGAGGGVALYFLGII